MRILLMLALVASCGDGGDFHFAAATVSGVVEIGDTVAQAQVYADYYDDNIADRNEIPVLTDATGNFTMTFENDGPLFPHSIVAMVASDSISVGANMPVGFDVHLRAPLDGDHDTTGALSAQDDITVTGVVISPFTTIVVSEMANAGISQAAAESEVAGDLSASMLPLSGAPLDVRDNYVADPSDDAKQTRRAAGAFAAVLGTAITELNAAQSLTDVNKADYFDPIDAALVQQLPAIANGTYMFTQVFSAAQQTDVMANPQNYTSLFLDPSMIELALKAD